MSAGRDSGRDRDRSVFPQPQAQLPTLGFPVAQGELCSLCLGAAADRQELGISSLTS